MFEEEFACRPKYFSVVLDSGRFNEVGVGSEIVCFVNILLQDRGAYNDGEKAFREAIFSEPFEKFKAVKLRHFEIDEHDIGFRKPAIIRKFIDLSST